MSRTSEASRLDVPDPEAIEATPSMAAHVDRMLAQCRRQRGVMALVCVHVERIEVDGETASAALRREVCAEVLRRMRSRVRGGDLMVPEGDRDAGVLMPGAGEEAALRVAQRFAQALAGTYRVGERLVQVSVRVGQASYPADGAMGEPLVRRARQPMGA